MLELKYKEYKTQDFENMNEVAEYLKSQKDLNKYELTHQTSSFYGCGKFEDTLKRLKYGDQVETTRYLDKLKQLEKGLESDEDFKMDVEGFAYDMGAVVSGEPECCINTGAPKTKPYMKIFIDIGYNGGVSADTIANRGVAICQLISNLLSQGYILDIYVIHFIDTFGDGHYAQRIKLTTDYFSISQLAYAGTCEFFRIVSWLLTAIQMKEHSYTGDGRSMPSGTVIKEMKKEGLYIPSGYTDGRFNSCNLEKAIKYVTEIYNAYIEEQKKSEIML